MLDTQRIVSELRAESKPPRKGYRSAGRNEYNKSYFGYEGDWSAGTKEASPSYCGRTKATIYADEKAMGREKEEGGQLTKCQDCLTDLNWKPRPTSFRCAGSGPCRCPRQTVILSRSECVGKKLCSMGSARVILL